VKENKSFINKLFSVFNKKVEKEKDEYFVIDKLVDDMNRLSNQISNLSMQVKEVKTKMDDELKAEIDSVQKKYIEFLEGKLICFDQEVSKLKDDQNAERYKLHKTFYENYGYTRDEAGSWIRR